MSDTRVSLVCSYAKLKDLAPFLVGEVSLLHIEPLDERTEGAQAERKKRQGAQARDHIEVLIEANLDNPGFEISRQDLKRLLIDHGFKSPSASVSHAMTALAEKYGLEVVGSSLWRIKHRRPSLARA